MANANTKDDEIRFIDPLSDFGFKRLFAEEANKDILIAFLNVVFPEHHIKDAKYLKTEQLGTSKEDRKALFDIICKADDGKEFLVEMQKAKQKYFHERALFYTSFPIMKQGQVGLQQEENGTIDHWDYNIDGVYFLGVENFISEDDNKVIHRYSLREDETGKLFTDKLRFVTIEIPKFQKSESELETIMDKWLFLLKNLPRLLDRPAALRDRIFSRIFDTVDFGDLDNVEQQNYKRAMDTWRDTQLQIEYAAEVAREEGIAQGKAEGVKEGEERGIAKGKRDGIKEGVLKVARNLLEIGTSIKDVAKVTGLSAEELSNLTAN